MGRRSPLASLALTVRGRGHEGRQYDMRSNRWVLCNSKRLHGVEALQAAAREEKCKMSSCLAHLKVLLHLLLRLCQHCLRGPADEQHAVRSALDDAPARSRERGKALVSLSAHAQR